MQVARRAGVRFIARESLDAFVAETARTLYRFDVRSPEEYAAGHLPGWRSAPGGQLVQATDHYVGTLGARIVLADDDGVRAPMTASWLMQMGWSEVYVLGDAFAATVRERGPEVAQVLGLDRLAVETVTSEMLAAGLAGGTALVVDLDSSLRYRDGHIPGAWFAVRSRLAADLAKIPASPLLVFTSPDGVIARFAASETAPSVRGKVAVLEGGTAAWTAGGRKLATGYENMAAPSDDVNYRSYDRTTGVETAMKAYLEWEIGLGRQIARDGDLRFRGLPPG